MSNALPRSKQAPVVAALVKGCSMRATERMTDVNRETIGTLLLRMGDGCAALLDETMRDLPCERLELDELWALVGKKQRYVRTKDAASQVGNKVTRIEKIPVYGAPEESLVSTSYVERQNLTVPMGVRRYTRLTNAFSKKLASHVAATALHFAHHNFARRQQILRTSPAMAAGLCRNLWDVEDLVEAALDGARP